MKIKVKLGEQKKKLIVAELNNVMDDHLNVTSSKDWTMDIIEEFIIQNLSKNDTIELIDRLNELPISRWTY
jgi:hypothetical protein